MSFGAPTYFSIPQRTPAFDPVSSIESLESALHSRPYSRGIESAESRTSWSSSSDVDWSRQRGGIEEAFRLLRQDNTALQKQADTWKAKYETLQAAYNLLLDRVSAPPEVDHKKLNPEDYKLVKYWYKHQWVSSIEDRVTDIPGKIENEEEEIEMDADDEQVRATSPAPGAQRGQGHSRLGINVAMRYIEDQHGQVIDGHRAREIRIHARANFVGFAMQEKIFSSWGDVDAASRKTYYREMANRFEELRYCDLDWKAEQIAIDTFPGWKVTWLKKQKKALKQQSVMKQGCQEMDEKVDTKRSKSNSDELTSSSMLSVPPSIESDQSQHSVPTVNIIPNSPIRPLQAEPSYNIQGLKRHPPVDCSFLQPKRPCNEFSINNPLAAGAAHSSTSNSPYSYTANPVMPLQHFEQIPPRPVPGNAIPAVSNVQNPPPPMKRLRTGTSKMRPSKTSTTPRNLCALEWTIANPKGTADEFGAYYDGLSEEEKLKWESVSLRAKESGNTA